MGGAMGELSGPDLGVGIGFNELEDGKPLAGHANGEAVILVRRGETAFAITANCTHYGGPLAEGLVVGHTVRCPWHHACFDLRNGEPVGAPALMDAACYEVHRAGELVQVRGKKGGSAKKPGTTSQN